MMQRKSSHPAPWLQWTDKKHRTGAQVVLDFPTHRADPFPVLQRVFDRIDLTKEADHE